MTKKAKKANNRTIAIRKKKFVKEYVKTGNGTQSAIKAGYAKAGAGVAATRLLNDANVRQEIINAFNAIDLSTKEVFETHKRNILQDKHLPTSQKAIKDYYEITGIEQKEQKNVQQVAFIIED